MRKFLIPAVLVAAVVAVLFGYVLVDEPFLANSRAKTLPVDPTPLIAETAQGDKSFTIEIADDGQEREAGLMFRKDMDDNHGMLFVFDRPQMVSFWMKDTPMPLDLLFVGQDGRVRAIKHGEPYSEAVIASAEPVRFVLELKAGTSEREGIANGNKLRHPAINEAPTPGSGG